MSQARRQMAGKFKIEFWENQACSPPDHVCLFIQPVIVDQVLLQVLGYSSEQISSYI